MKQEGLRFFTDINLTLIGLGIFFTFFAFLLLRVIVYRKSQINYLESLPFDENQGKNSISKLEVQNG